jgi:hypothetical protein
MQPPINRLSISHILLWMTTTAVAFTVLRLSLESGIPGSANLSVTWAWAVHLLLQGTIYGLALAGLTLFVVRRLKGKDGSPSQLGHWVLILVGSLGLISLLGQLLCLVVEGELMAILLNLDGYLSSLLPRGDWHHDDCGLLRANAPSLGNLLNADSVA